MALLTEHAEQDTLGGGRYRQTIALKRIAFRRDGNLRRITNALAGTGDPALSVGVDELVQFRVADRLAGQSPVIHFGKGASNVRLTPLATNNVGAVVAGSVVTYPGAWDNADLRLSIGGHIVRKEILLRAGHPSSFAFRIANHAGLNIDTLETPDFRILQPSMEGPDGQHIPLVWTVSSSGGKYVLTVTLPPGDYAGWVVDPTLVLQPDATDGLDTMLYQYNPTTNYGTLDRFAIGEQNNQTNTINRGLVKLDLSSLPDTAIISSTTLSLWLWQNGDAEGGADSNNTFGVFRVKRAWVEAQATWNIYSTANNWGTAGCADTTNDREAVAIGTSPTLAPTDLAGAQKDTSLTGATKAALDLGSGWALVGTTELNDLYVFCSSDNATAANRPKLTIEYTLPSTGMSRAPIASWCH